MNSEKIRIEVEELLLLVASWKDEDAPSVIEHDVVLAKIAKLYERVKLLTPTSMLTSTSEPKIEPQKVAEEETIAEASETMEVAVEAKKEVVRVEEPLSFISDDSIFAIDLDGISLIEPEVKEESKEEVTEEEMAEEKVTEEEAKEEETEEVKEEGTEETEEEEVKEEEEKKEEKLETQASVSEPITEQIPDPEPAKASDMLFDIAPIPKKSRSRRRVLMSLYHDEESQASDKLTRREQPAVVTRLQREKRHTEAFLIDDLAPLQEPKVETSAQEEMEPRSVEQPQSQSEFISSSATVGNSSTPAPTLADSLASGVETLADRYAEKTPQLVGEARSGYNSFDKLGINERYLLARDLFGDDPQLCIEELARIGAFDNYDDAIIYIAENYNWSGESEGAKLLLSVLERKFNIS